MQDSDKNPGNTDRGVNGLSLSPIITIIIFRFCDTGAVLLADWFVVFALVVSAKRKLCRRVEARHDDKIRRVQQR